MVHHLITPHIWEIGSTYEYIQSDCWIEPQSSHGFICQKNSNVSIIQVSGHQPVDVVVVVDLPDPSWGWERESTPRSPNNRETHQGRDQRSKIEKRPKMARRMESSAGQSSTKRMDLIVVAQSPSLHWKGSKWLVKDETLGGPPYRWSSDC